MKPITHYTEESGERSWWRSPGYLVLAALLVLSVLYVGLHGVLWASNGTTNADRAIEAVTYAEAHCGQHDIALAPYNPWTVGDQHVTYNLTDSEGDVGRLLWDTHEQRWQEALLECP